MESEKCKKRRKVKLMDNEKIISLRMERQHLLHKADEQEYISLYRDLQPGVNVYWNGFGQLPVLSYRAAFDDMEFNRVRQRERKLVKGRFAGGNLGWIEPKEITPILHRLQEAFLIYED